MLPAHVRGDNRLFAMNGTLLPALAIALILALSLLDLIFGLLSSARSGANKRTPGPDDVRLSGASLYGLALVTVAGGLFAFALPWAGYLPASFALVLVLMIGTGGRSPVILLSVAVAAVIVLFLGLRYGLGVHLQIWPDLAGLVA